MQVKGEITMPVTENTIREYSSGDDVEPGVYLDMESGDVVHILERDALPEGTRVVHYRRRFRKVAAPEHKTHRSAA
jgi:hypothetical protein